MSDVLYQVDIGYACGGVVVRGGFVHQTAPIFNWAIGKKWTTFADWAERKGAKITEV